MRNTTIPTATSREPRSTGIQARVVPLKGGRFRRAVSAGPEVRR